MKNGHLEMLSEMVRRGEPLSLQETMDVIEYQNGLKNERKNMKWWEGILYGTPIGEMVNFIKKKMG